MIQFRYIEKILWLGILKAVVIIQFNWSQIPK